MKRILLTLICSLALALPAVAATTLLDGKTFEGEMKEKGDAKGDADKLIFKDGQFLSSACKEYGFNETSYTAERSGNVIKFSAVAKNDNDVTMTWSGEIEGDKATASALRREGDKEEQYEFAGKLRQ